MSDSKIIEFSDHRGVKCELWGDLSDAPVRLINGIAGAFAHEGVCYVSFYEPTGLNGAEGEIMRLSTRIALPVHLIGLIAAQFQEISEAFGKRDENIASQSPSDVSRSDLRKEQDELGERIF